MFSIFLGMWVYAQVNANTVDWADYSIYSDYDTGDEELLIKFTAFSDWDPKEDFFLEMDFDDEACEIDLEYRRFQILGECVLDIDIDDVRWIYDTEFFIFDEEDEDVYDRSVIIEIDGYSEELDWENIKAEAVYDEEDEDLDLKIYLEDITRTPDYEYEIEFEINDRNFIEDFRYNIDEEELVVILDISIDEQDIRDEYEIEFEVVNKDLDDEEVADSEFEFDVDIISEDDDFDWDELEIVAVYDEDSERLNIHVFLTDIIVEPKKDYESFIELEDEEYDERFKYDDDNEELRAEYSIKIDEDDIENSYDIELIVEDDDSEEVYDEDIDIDVDLLSELNDFDWEDLEVIALYDEEDEKLYVDLILEDVSSRPGLEFVAELEFEDEDDEGEFSYNSGSESLELSFEFRIDEDDIENEYEFEIIIEDENGERVLREDFDIDVEDYEEREEETEAVVSSTVYDWEDMSISLDYDSNSQILTLRTELGDIIDYPKLDYYADIAISPFGKIGSKLRYNSQDDTLYGVYEIFVTRNDIEDSYSFTLFVNDENSNLEYVLNDEFNVVYDGEDTLSEEKDTGISQAIRDAVSRFIDRTYNRFDTRAAAHDYFERVIPVLDAYADRNTKYRSVVDDINFLIREELDS